jgi:hypothetical protein
LQQAELALDSQGFILGVRKLHFMAGAKKNKPRPQSKPGAKPRDPEWTAGLKRLYDSVVEEPIPDSFKDLLKKLDSAD